MKYSDYEISRAMDILKEVCESQDDCGNCVFGKQRAGCMILDECPSNWNIISVINNDTLSDNVNHPAHYETGKFECIDVMLETQGVKAVKHFCICNALKYLYRHKRKNGVEDVKKAKWYLDKYIELEKS